MWIISVERKHKIRVRLKKEEIVMNEWILIDIDIKENANSPTEIKHRSIRIDVFFNIYDTILCIEM